MKLHLPLSLRSSLLAAVMALSAFSPAQADEYIITSDTLYTYADAFSEGSASYIGAGSTPTYDLTFEALICYKENTNPPEIAWRTHGFSLKAETLTFSNIDELTFKSHRFSSSSSHQKDVVMNGHVYHTSLTMFDGGVIGASASDEISTQDTSCACVVNITENGDVLFEDNRTNVGSGAAIAVKVSTLNILNNRSIVFKDNSAYRSGGAIDAIDSDVYIKGNDEVVFEGNTANNDAGAISIGRSTYTENCNLFVEDNKSITFAYNTSSSGGAINVGTIGNGTVVFRNNVGDETPAYDISFIGNESYYDGGAINSVAALSFVDNGDIYFADNKVTSPTSTLSYDGGAIYISANYAPLTFDGNHSITFKDNYSTHNAGAISVSGTETSLIIKNTSGDVIFSGNEACMSGGAISGTVTFTGNKGRILFEDNVVTGPSGGSFDGGGAISGRTATFTGNADLIFKGNSATWRGGALNLSINNSSYVGGLFQNNEDILFEGNSAIKGGAIFSNGMVKIENNGNIAFTNNSADDSAAIYSDGELHITGNESVSFTGNNAKDAATIYTSKKLWIYDNLGDVTFKDNYVRRYDENDELESIVLNSIQGTRTYYMYLAAKEGQSIIFADPIFQDVSSGDFTYLNQYTTQEGDTITSQGTILFTGKDARTRLASIWSAKGLTPQGDAFEAALAESVSSNLNTTYVYGGTLAVEDGAHVKFQGFYAESGSTVRLKDATASVLYGQWSYLPYPTFRNGSTLLVENDALLDISTEHDTLLMQGGSVLRLQNGELAVGGKLQVGEKEEDVVTMALSGYKAGEYTILTTSGITKKGGLNIIHDGEWNREDGRLYYLVSSDETTMTAKVGECKATLQWTAGNGTWETSEWKMSSPGVSAAAGEVLLMDDKHYFDGDAVEFNQGGKVNIAGAVSPSSIRVSGAADVTLQGNGSVVGDSTSLIKEGSCTLTIATANTYAGGTIVEDGTLVVAHANALGNGEVTLSGGTLRLAADTLMGGDFCLDGGTLELDANDYSLQVDGCFSIESDSTIRLAGFYEDSKTYTLLSCGSLAGSLDDLSFVSDYGDRYTFTASKVGQSLLVTVGLNSTDLVWLNDKKAVWQQGAGGWQNAAGVPQSFTNGDAVTIGDGTVTIEGVVKPSSILLNPTKSLTFKTKFDKKTGLWSGAIDGEDITLTIAAGPKGKVTMNDGNTYTGETIIESGTVSVGGVDSFGESDITLEGGTLDLKSKAVDNAITLTDSAAIKGGAKYVGEFTLNGGELQKGSVLNVADTATLAGGVMNGTLSGTGTVYVTGDVQLGDAAKLTTNGLTISGKL